MNGLSYRLMNLSIVTLFSEKIDFNGTGIAFKDVKLNRDSVATPVF